MSYESGPRTKRPKLSNESDEGLPRWKVSTRFPVVEGGREWTVSIALPGSVVSDARSPDQQAAICGRIARTVALFGVDEIVVYDDSLPSERRSNVDPSSYTADTDPCHYLSHVLTYLETPPFMRRNLFPLHQNFRLASKVPFIDMPHHPHPNEWLPFREGVTVGPVKEKGKKGTIVDLGLNDSVIIKEEIPPATRVTLKFPDELSLENATPAHPAAPRLECGLYWGYSVRRASSISAVFTESPYDDGYDLSIGTSERGQNISRAFPVSRRPFDFKHLVVVFGGPKGIEYAVGNDETLNNDDVTVTRARELFDYWINILPGQGSRNMFTDEALTVALSALTSVWETPE